MGIRLLSLMCRLAFDTELEWIYDAAGLGLQGFAWKGFCEAATNEKMEFFLAGKFSLIITFCFFHSKVQMLEYNP